MRPQNNMKLAPTLRVLPRAESTPRHPGRRLRAAPAQGKTMSRLLAAPGLGSPSSATRKAALEQWSAKEIRLLPRLEGRDIPPRACHASDSWWPTRPPRRSWRERRPPPDRPPSTIPGARRRRRCRPALLWPPHLRRALPQRVLTPQRHAQVQRLREAGRLADRLLYRRQHSKRQ